MSGTTRFKVRLDFELEVEGENEPLPGWCNLALVTAGIREGQRFGDIPYDLVRLLPGGTVKLRLVRNPKEPKQ